MTATAPVHHAFIVALEYDGADGVTGGSAGQVLFEHAYDLGTAALADHGPGAGPVPRVAFPDPTRAWNTEPGWARCLPCDDAVLDIVSAAIRAAITTLLPAPLDRTDTP